MKLKHVLCFLLVGMLLSISGCVKPGPKFTEHVQIPAGQSVVYFYRQANPLGAMSMPGVEANGREVLDSLPTWSWWPYFIKPGEYHFEPTLFGLYKKESVDITSPSPGERFYVKLNVNIGYVGLNLVNEDQAVDEMTKCFLVPQDSSGKVKVDTQRTPPSDETPPTPDVPQHAYLYVKTAPDNARVRIMNIKPKFTQGIELDKGQYKVETSAPGYKTDVRWINIKEFGDFKMAVSLEKH